MLQFTIAPAGDDAFLVTFDEIGFDELHGSAAAVRSLAHVRACIVGHESLLVLVDSDAEVGHLMQGVSTALHSPNGKALLPVSAVRTVEVDFGDEWAPDLPLLLEQTGLNRQQFIERIQSLRLRARYLGFMPGFAYLEGLPAEWSLPRKSVARARVPAGSLGIAGQMAAFYPDESPGGWNLLGRTPEILWDSQRNPPSLISPGDEVRLVDVTGRARPRSLSMRVFPQSGEPLAEVLQPGQLSRLIGPPSYERYATGVAAGGPFDRELAALANRLVGNPDDAVVIESAAVGPGLRFLRGCMVAIAGADVTPLVNGHKVESQLFPLDEGDLLTVGRIRNGFRVTIAMRGGIVDPRARHARRPFKLEKGDVLATPDLLAEKRPLRPHSRHDRLVIRVMGGPHDVDEDQLGFLLGTEWTVSPNLDRIGVRLSPKGTPHVPPAFLPSCGMRFGSVQWHPGGEIVIMGPDHPITGGYLQPMTVRNSDLWKIGQLTPGDKVRFAEE